MHLLASIAGKKDGLQCHRDARLGLDRYGHGDELLCDLELLYRPGL